MVSGTDTSNRQLRRDARTERGNPTWVANQRNAGYPLLLPRQVGHDQATGLTRLAGKKEVFGKNKCELVVVLRRAFLGSERMSCKSSASRAATALSAQLADLSVQRHDTLPCQQS